MEKDKATEAAKAWLDKIRKDDNREYDPLVTYFFINKNLDMSAGKIAVQTARSAQVMLLNEMKADDTLLLTSLDELFQDDFMHGNKSIALRANENQLNRILTGDLSEKLAELSEQSGYPIRTYPVYDIGANEVETNSLTVVAMTPLPASVISAFTRKFHVY